MDAIWPDTWPTIADIPPSDPFVRNVNSAIGRICIARHPLRRGADTVSQQRLPGAIQMSQVDGQAGKLPLQKLKSVFRHKDYVSVEDPWRTTPP